MTFGENLIQWILRQTIADNLIFIVAGYLSQSNYSIYENNCQFKNFELTVIFEEIFHVHFHKMTVFVATNSCKFEMLYVFTMT